MRRAEPQPVPPRRMGLLYPTPPVAATKRASKRLVVLILDDRNDGGVPAECGVAMTFFSAVSHSAFCMPDSFSIEQSASQTCALCAQFID